uniref:Aminoacyl tRNA synthetase complex interacting multifunctional protein 1 n=1 Tax=Aotus nancymaae TaxID=37293 RepID=A0A2K5EDS8_AOTNA
MAVVKYLIFCRLLAKMANNDAVLKRLEQKGAEADQIIEYLKQQVALLKEKAILQATLREEKKLRVENAKLKKEIEELKQELIQAEIQNGVKQIPFPSGTALEANSVVSKNVIQSTPVTTISSGTKEQIKGGTGDEKKMQNRMVVLLCNLKPAKMRGVLSQAMVMCASSPEKVEILAPPNGSVPGDRITFAAFPGMPDKELNPKKKIWEQIQPDLHTNDECVATYKGVPFEVKGKGVCRAQTMSNSGIK